MTRMVRERVARSTGTTIQVLDNRDGSFDMDDPNGWATVCVEHGGVCTHPTRYLAEEWAAEPEQWCPGCQEADNGQDPFGQPYG